MAARALLLAACAATLAFLALGLRQADQERRARAAVLPLRTLDDAAARRARGWLDRAGEAYPGVEPDILRGILELDRDRPRAARRHLLAATRREPENIEAWAWLANAARDAGDDALFQRARARILELRPPVER